jgi:hypothetical protein
MKNLYVATVFISLLLEGKQFNLLRVVTCKVQRAFSQPPQCRYALRPLL